MLPSDAAITRDPKVVYRHLQEGGVLLHLDSGQYYGVNQTGYLIWTLIDERISISVLLARLHEHFHNAPGLEEDVHVFLDGLHRRGLICVLSTDGTQP